MEKRNHASDDVLINVDGVSKKFCRYLRKSMWYGIQDISKSLVGIGTSPGKLRKDEFWAVDDVSFQVHRGDVLGLIGPNGSGKSTMLKMLSGVFMPDSGKIEIKGKVGALIELGAGFHQMLTGRENIRVNGAILGMDRREIDEKFNDIVAFADIGDFLDTPVKNYSSGMFVRLGFAIAAQLNPDVLLIDEVLAVGDVGFRAKCYNAIYKMADSAAVVFVSHDMPMIKRLCSQVIVMSRGKVHFHGADVSRGIEEYLGLFDSDRGKVIEPGASRITGITLSAQKVTENYEINFGDSLVVDFTAHIEARIKQLEVSVMFNCRDMEGAAQCNSKNNGITVKNIAPEMRITVRIPSLNLNPDTYYISLIVRDAETNHILCWHHFFTVLKVVGSFLGGAPTQYVGEWHVEGLPQG